MRIFNFGRSLTKAQEKDKTAEHLNQEVENFNLAGLGGFLTVVKYAVYSVLAALNWHLFVTTIHGLWGWAIGSIAILSECFAIYCWNKQNRSAGAHKKALQFFAIGFTAVSFVHACASLWEISGAGTSIGRPLWFYSNFVAFPLIFSMMVVAVCVIYYTHWSTKISEERAGALLEIEKGRARLLTEQIDLQNQAEVERARLKFFEGQILLEEEYVRAVERLAQVKKHGEQVLNSITDPEVKSQILTALGRVVGPATDQKRINPLPSQAQKDESK